MSPIERFGHGLLIALLAGAAFPVALSAQSADQTTLQRQVEKLNAGQDALRQQILAMQKQLQEIRALLQARPASRRRQTSSSGPRSPAGRSKSSAR